jgi:pyruvate formate lyase activating enzyme
MVNMEGRIFRIKRFSIHDGPGIRTSVFLKGCPLNCIWCHNPEGISSEMTIWHHSNICISCGLCTSVCPTRAIKLTPDNKIVIDRSGCNNSGECVKICPSQALQFTGSVVTDSQVLSEILKDKIFYESSSGGMTLTGGEPLFQVDFSATILKSCKENGIHTAIETCLYTDTENIQKILEYTDLFITDLKIYNEELHRKYTGRSNEIILQNFRFIAESGRDIIVRTPVIPGITDSSENKEAIRDFVRKTRFDIPVEYINFNPLTRNNYDKLGIPYLI